MGIIKDFLARKREKEERFKQFQEQDNIVNSVEERKTSHAERELKKILEKEKQDTIKLALYWESKKQQQEDLLRSRNAMKFNPEFFNNTSILKQKNNFLNGGNF